MSESAASDNDLTGEPHATPPGEHGSELPGDADQPPAERDAQEENAETTLDQPSQ